MAQPGKWSDDPQPTYLDSCQWELSWNVGFGISKSYDKDLWSPDLGGSLSHVKFLFKAHPHIHMYGQFGFVTSIELKNRISWTYWTTGMQINFMEGQTQPYFLLGFGMMAMQAPFPVETKNSIIMIDPWKSPLFQFGFGINLLSGKGFGLKAEVSNQLMNFPGEISPATNPPTLNQYLFSIGLVKRFK